VRLPRLILITDWSLGRDCLLQRLEEVLPLGPLLAVQHRHPEAAARLFLQEARLVAECCAHWQVPLFINGRLDVALLLNAHLHLPASTFLANEVRPHLPENRWISASVHNDSEAVAAQGSDLALVSPVFSPFSKPNDRRHPLGPQGFAVLAAQLPCPAYALGGVGLDTAPLILAARGAACLTGVLGTTNPRAVAEGLLCSFSGVSEDESHCIATGPE
jgi:thiamine-phosphate pyrophosphorylase